MMLRNFIEVYLAKQRSLGIRFESAEVLMSYFERGFEARGSGNPPNMCLLTN
ncbi:hypothetical protein J2Z31_002645 [Sinorhizobium kostiense]|uniref:Uncharacterized protein n=1 Tax=Sinorhizobium kostiense TaxID=76747 RepID=A0ABS4QZS5_9HYPH|nr:hypothetical protein [Sinorhizobium kostiense]MBP2236131.1 hypothetical protein [Sinorhizobium kostiense]